MKIVIIGGSIPTTTFIDGLINTMAAEGYEMIVIGKKTGKYGYNANVRVIYIPRGRAAQILFIFKNVFKCNLKTLKKIHANSASLSVFFNDLLFYLPIVNAQPDRIHIQWATFLKGKELLFNLYPKQVLLSLRGAHINYKPITHPEFKEVYLKLFPKVHKFHAVSDAIATEAIKYGANRDKIQTIYSYVKDDVIVKKKHAKGNNVLKIISIGRFHWKKGYEYALDALGILKKNGILFEYKLVAQGTVPDSIIFQISQLDLKKEIIIINGLPHKDVLDAIEESDVFLLPSIEEGIANVALEAMAIGTPVISTDCGGMREVITNSINGLMVDNMDAVAMADALQVFNNLNAGDRDAIAGNAQKTIHDFHNKSLFVANYKRFYES